MSEVYDATYSAICSRIGSPDIQGIVERVARDAFDMGYLRERVTEQVYSIANQIAMPSVIYKPEIIQDGDQWIALYGRDLAIGVVGCGHSPAEAMAAFDKAWTEKITTAKVVVDAAEGERR